MLILNKLILINKISPYEHEMFISMGGKIINVSEIPNKSNIILEGSILLPPYEAMSALLDNNADQFSYIYDMYLFKPEIEEFICAIIRATMNNIPIGVFIDGGDFTSIITQVFSSHLSNNFGVMMETPMNGFMYDNRFDIVNLNRLYMYNLINYEEFLYYYPPNTPVDSNISYKLAEDIAIWSPQQEIINNPSNNGVKVPIQPMIFGDDK